MNYIDEYRNNPAAANAIKESILDLADNISYKNSVNIMEVCGSHTMAISRYAIRDILPENINLISGPGCPVCVTDSGYIDTAIEISQNRDIIIVTFGDMLNVPGEKSSLAETRAASGTAIEVCYSPAETLQFAKEHPDKEIIFLGIGFETTIAPVISIIDIAQKEKIKNVSILTAFKLVPPALKMLLTDAELRIDAFLCPAHVSAIIGAKSYEPIVQKYNVPCVIAGFEPLDILLGIQKILEQIASNRAFVDNQYTRVVRYHGNPIAQNLINKYLEPCDAWWRGIGVITQSGMRLRDKFSDYDAEKKFGIKVKHGTPNKKCKCGEILKGKLKPQDCPAFGTACTPLHPVGPCMVSSEGTCAAFYKYEHPKHI